MPNLHNGSSHCNILRLDDYTDSVKSHMAGDHSSWRSKGTQRHSGVLWGCRTVELRIAEVDGSKLTSYISWTDRSNDPNMMAILWHGGCICCWPAAGVFFRQRPPAVPIPRDHVEQHEILLLGRRDWAAPGQWLFFATGFCSQLNSRMI